MSIVTSPAGRCRVGLLCLALGAGCSSTAKPTDAAAPDAGVDLPGADQPPPRREASVDQRPAVGLEMGEGCQDDKQCKEGTACGLYDASLKLGLCTTTCTPDKWNTPANEDTCPTGFICGIFPQSGKPTQYYCVKKCTPSLTKNPCPSSSGRTCSPLSVKYTQVYGQAACFYPSCKTDKDCPVLSAVTCAADPGCGTVGADAFCAEGHCVRPGKCGPGGLCGLHTLGNKDAKVGDPCKGDLDCSVGNGYCIFEEANPYGNPYYHNGYCSVPHCAFGKDVPEFACPAGSSCNRLFGSGLCQKSCAYDKASDCRGYAGDNGGDYECYGYNLIKMDNVTLVSDTPVCATAPGQPCAGLGITCADLAETANPTHMSCRDSKTGAAKTNPNDPSGICLDDTPSGPFQP